MNPLDTKTETTNRVGKHCLRPPVRSLMQVPLLSKYLKNVDCITHRTTRKKCDFSKFLRVVTQVILRTDGLNQANHWPYLHLIVKYKTKILESHICTFYLRAQKRLFLYLHNQAKTVKYCKMINVKLSRHGIIHSTERFNLLKLEKKFYLTLTFLEIFGKRNSENVITENIEKLTKSTYWSRPKIQSGDGYLLMFFLCIRPPLVFEMGEWILTRFLRDLEDVLSTFLSENNSSLCICTNKAGIIPKIFMEKFAVFRIFRWKFGLILIDIVILDKFGFKNNFLFDFAIKHYWQVVSISL